MAGILQEHARRNGGAEAFRFLDTRLNVAASISYAGLDHRAALIAAQLQAAQCSGERVVLVYPAGLDFIEALFGCFYAGCIAVTVPIPVMEPRRAFERASSIVKDAGPRGILTLSDWVASTECGMPADTKWIATDALASDGQRWSGEEPAPESIALLQYTSGTTGNPRGVVLSHANLIANQEFLTKTFDINSGDRAVCWLPLYHDMGLIGAVLQTVFVGGSCALMSPLTFLQRPMRWLEAISNFQATISMAPNFAFEHCVRRCGTTQADFDLSSWRIAICGGEPIRAETLTHFTDCFAPHGFMPSAFAPCYGLAESTLLVTAPAREPEFVTAALPADSTVNGTRAEQTLRGRLHVCCGEAGQDHEIAIVDPVSRRRIAEGDEGEIWVRGPSIAQGYWRRNEETAEIFRAEISGERTAGEWLRTGDLGFVGPHGLFVTGRRKDLIILRGANIDPLDVETVARASHESLANGSAAAFSIEGDDTETVVLVLEVDRSLMRSREVEPVIEAATRALTRAFGFKLHDMILVAPGSLPRTTSGKIQRHLCRLRYEEGEIRPIADCAHPALGRTRQARVAEQQC